MADRDNYKKTDEKKSRQRSWNVYDYIAAALWVTVAAAFFTVVHKGLNRTWARTGTGAGSASVTLTSSIGGDEAPAPVAAPSPPAAPVKAVRDIAAKAADKPAVRSNSLLTKRQVTWADISSASEADLTTFVATWLFAEADQSTCTYTWVPRARPGEDGAWPLCTQIIRPGPSRCHVYSIGVGSTPDFDVAGATELGCNVRSFDPTRAAPENLPHGVVFYKIGLSGENNLSDKQMPVATLSTLQSLRHEQGRHLYYLKWNCEGCEFGAATQLLKDLGPRALHDSDMFMVEVHLGSKQFSLRSAAALVALLQSSGFRLYYRTINVADGAVTTASARALLSAARELYGRERADLSSASRSNLIKLGTGKGKYDPKKEAEWKSQIDGDAPMASIKMAFYRDSMLPRNSTVPVGDYELEIAGCLPAGTTM